MRKKNTTQARVKIGVKIILYLVTASFLGAIISGINVKNKYGEVMQQVKELSDNADNVILDYTKVINEVSPSLQLLLVMMKINLIIIVILMEM